MEANKILNADFLDILFEGRNKEYGAYQLRKTYNKRIIIAMVVTASILLLLFLGSVIASVIEGNKPKEVTVETEAVLEEVKKEQKPDIPPPPPPPAPAPPPKVEIKQFTPPQVVPDNEVKEDEKPPKQEELETAQIGTVNQEGVKDEGIVAPPTESGTGTAIQAPKVETEDYDKVFTKVEVAASFPGGLEGWRRYLERNLQYPEAAQENGTQGVIRVQMVVDKDGNITEVQALNNPGDGLAEEAMRVIKKGPKWVPAEQNGRKVTYRFVQTVTFQLQ